MFTQGLKWMFLILGTMIGAGYASGREIWQFFGEESALGIIIFSLLLMFCIYVIMTLSYKFQTNHYMPILETLLGKKIAVLYDGMVFLFLFSTTMVMIAGGGAALEVLRLPYWGGIALISICLVGLFFGEKNGLVVMNTMVIPLLLVFLLGLLIRYANGAEHVLRVDWQKQSNWHAAFSFTSLNIVSLLAVLGGIGGSIKSKQEIWVASVGSGLVLGAVSFLYNQSLLQISHEIALYEIPLFALLKNYPFIITVAMSCLLLVAIYTTAASGVFGLVTRLKNKFRGPMWLLALIITCLMIPFTTLKFSTLIAILYPIYGILNLYVLAAILIYPITNRAKIFK